MISVSAEFALSFSCDQDCALCVLQLQYILLLNIMQPYLLPPLLDERDERDEADHCFVSTPLG